MTITSQDYVQKDSGISMEKITDQSGRILGYIRSGFNGKWGRSVDERFFYYQFATRQEAIDDLVSFYS